MPVWAWLMLGLTASPLLALSVLISYWSVREWLRTARPPTSAQLFEAASAAGRGTVWTAAGLTMVAAGLGIVAFIRWLAVG